MTEQNVVFANVMGLHEDGTPDWLYCGKTAPRPFFFCGAIRRTWFEKLRGMDEDYPAGGYDDNDFADRLAKEGVTFEYSDVSVHHQWHPRPAMSAEAAATVYAEKTRRMASGEIGTARNLGREWGALEPLVIPPIGLPPRNMTPGAYRYAADGCTVDWNDRYRR